MADVEARPTLRDVAVRAAVSLATASRALNSRGDVRPETRDRVRRAADELGFRTPSAIRSVSGRSLTVGLLTSDSVGRFSTPVMSGAEDALGAGRVAVLLTDARGDPIREQHYMRILVERKVDGIIVVGQDVDPRPAISPAPSVPVVYAYAPSTDPDSPSFVPDNAGGAVLAMSHLLALGRTRIAHITGPPTRAATVERVAGIRQVVRSSGVELAGEVMYGGGWSQRWGRHSAAILLSRTPDVDAVFCGSDQIAVGVLETLHDHGRRTPDDVAVVGFDNWEVFASETRPSLTTIDMNLEHLGRMAATHLFEAMQGPTTGGLRRLPCHLVLRESTAPTRPDPGA